MEYRQLQVNVTEVSDAVCQRFTTGLTVLVLLAGSLIMNAAEWNASFLSYHARFYLYCFFVLFFQ